jgi:hypothetical protein
MPDSCPRSLFNVRACILTYSTSASINCLVARQGPSAVAEFPLQNLGLWTLTRHRSKGCQPAFRVVHLNRFYTLVFVGTT